MAGGRPFARTDAWALGRRITASPVATVVTAGLLALAVTYGFSRVTGWLSDSVAMPVGAATLAIAVLLGIWAPHRFGLGLGKTREHLLLIAVSILAIATVVIAFRMTGSTAPYDATVGEFLLVPMGEELLFRGVLLATLLELFRSGLVPHYARCAVVVSAVAFGIGHLGNLGHVDTAFVILQVFIATAFGIAAGIVRVRTESVVGPVLMHMTMNIVAVV